MIRVQVKKTETNMFYGELDECFHTDMVDVAVSISTISM